MSRNKILRLLLCCKCAGGSVIRNIHFLIGGKTPEFLWACQFDIPHRRALGFLLEGVQDEYRFRESRHFIVLYIITDINCPDNAKPGSGSV